MKFDAPTFARAWLSVAQASATKDDVSALSKTIAIEEFLHGVRLVATDRFILLTAWVPELRVAGSDDPYYAEPALDEAPDRTVIAADLDGRGKSLLGYVLSLASRKDKYEHGEIPIDLTFDVRIKPGETEPETFEGLEPTYTVLSVPDVERVYLAVVETTYPSWRNVTVGFRAEEAKGIALNPEFVTRVCNVRRWCLGPLVWTFGGSDRVASVDYPESDPHVTGFVMPTRWVLPGEAGPEDEDEEPVSAGAALLRNGSGVITAADLDALRETYDEDEPHPYVIDPGNAVEKNPSCEVCGRHRTEDGFVHTDDVFRCKVCEDEMPVSIEDADASQSYAVEHVRGHVGRSGDDLDNAMSMLEVVGATAADPQAAFRDAMHAAAASLPEGVTVVTSDGRESEGKAPSRHLSAVPADSPRGEANNRDGLLRDAAMLVVETKFGSESMIQRKLKVGYARANRIMSELEEHGIVGPKSNGRAREVLVATTEDAEEMLNR